MKVRIAVKDDIPSVGKLAGNNNLSIPQEGILVIAEENGEIKAFANIRIVAFIEPMASKSPFASKLLFDFVTEKLKVGGHRILRAFIKEENSGLLKKLGFGQVFEDYQSFEKIL